MKKLKFQKWGKREREGEGETEAETGDSFFPFSRRAIAINGPEKYENQLTSVH